MTKIIAIFLATIGFIGNSDAATTTRRTRTQTADTGATPVATTTARSAVSARAATQPATISSARSAVRTTSARAATQPTTAPKVAARAATTTQKVVSTGTKVATAAKNVIVNEECRAKYNGCMDSFCMLDNATGGRCMCSNRITELNTVMNEIEKLDQQTYQMATYGVERIEMGDAADAAITAANDAAQKVLNGDTPSSNNMIDTASWFANPFGDEEEDGNTYTSAVDGKTGDALHITASGLCAEQIPECAADIDMLQMLYAQQIKSDCAAYENTLKQQKTASQQKLYTAEQALRAAALEQFKNANKYDLGQCTLQFKQCMQTTADCGDDFSKCASMSGMDNSGLRKSSTNHAQTYTIHGAVTTIDISASTYDSLMAKKPLCEHILKSCVNADKKVTTNKLGQQETTTGMVWETFLKEVAPQIKNAELIAEDNARQDCIGNISSCFQKACRDKMDPNDPDGSYDMCLTQPETMLNVCLVPLNACGIDATSANTAEKSPIWEYVVARLASMRVDSCTNAVKECLTATDRCGKDYTQCIGMTTEAIMDMCPYEKLVGCQYKYNDTTISTKDKAEMDEEIYSLVQGIFMNIDNNMLKTCQKALDESMLRVCGNTEDCNAMIVDEYLGARTLEYELCAYDTKGDTENGQKFLTGTFSNDCRNDVSLIQDYELGAVNMSSPSTTTLNNGENSIAVDNKGASGSTVAEILSQLQKNITGTEYGTSLKIWGARINNQIPWSGISFVDQTDGSLVENYANIVKEDQLELYNNFAKQDENVIQAELMTLQNNIASAIASVESDPTVQFCMTGRRVQGMNGRELGGIDEFETNNDKRQSAQYARFPELTHQVRNMIATSALKAAQENYNRKYDELETKMYKDYVTLGERMAKIDEENELEVRRDSARMACLAMAGGSITPEPIIRRTKNNRDNRGETSTSTERDVQLSASAQMSSITDRETVTATFSWETLSCHKCVKTQKCKKQRRNWCKAWADPVEKCTDIQF